jgi:hypothetical protein
MGKMQLHIFLNDLKCNKWVESLKRTTVSTDNPSTDPVLHTRSWFHWVCMLTMSTNNSDVYVTREWQALGQMCTRFLHACSALCKCANWCVEPAPPTIPHQADHLSLSLRVHSPSPPIADATLPSPATCQAGPFHPLHASTAQQHASSHTHLCLRRLYMQMRKTYGIIIPLLNLV